MELKLRETEKSVSFRDTAPIVYGIKVLDKNLITVIDCRIYGRPYGGRKAAVWVRTLEGNVFLGVGHATGQGYCKRSSSVASAIRDMGVPYELTDFDGAGMTPTEEGLEKLAIALGHKVATVVNFYG